jgi:hypothetical protein
VSRGGVGRQGLPRTKAECWTRDLQGMCFEVGLLQRFLAVSLAVRKFFVARRKFVGDRLLTGAICVLPIKSFTNTFQSFCCDRKEGDCGGKCSLLDREVPLGCEQTSLSKCDVQQNSSRIVLSIMLRWGLVCEKRLNCCF